jgi:fido (protein-threonine AMPylation protein)
MATSWWQILDRQYLRRRQEICAGAIVGNFDRDRLVAIHNYLFQDYPDFEKLMPADDRFFLIDPRPGVLRPQCNWHQSVRRIFIDGECVESRTIHSRMDDASLSRLDSALEQAQPGEFAKLSKAEYVTSLAKLFGDVDYTHPFIDGNARAGLLYVEQLAKASGREFDGTRLLTPEFQKNFNIARNWACLERAAIETGRNDFLGTLLVDYKKFEKSPRLEVQFAYAFSAKTPKDRVDREQDHGRAK